MRIILGISGASGVEMGHWLLAALRAQPDCETHLIVTAGAKATWDLETGRPLGDLLALADAVHDDGNLGAVISSGSFHTDGMVVLPCSMKSLAAIASGYAANLLVRAADVCLKEGRKVVLCPREMPLGRSHLRNMLTAAELGCTIIPPMLTFYNQSPEGPRRLEQQLEHLIGKILMQFGLRHAPFKPWQGMAPQSDRA